MGAYLSEPITKKESSDEVGKNVAYGASSMQGWRISQEVSEKSCCRDGGGDGGNGRDVRARAFIAPLPNFGLRVSPVIWLFDYRPPCLVDTLVDASPRVVAPRRGRAGERGRRRESRAQHPTLVGGFLATRAFIYQQMRYLDKTGSLRHRRSILFWDCFVGKIILLAT